MTDLELLRIEIRALWVTDQRGRIVVAHGDDPRPAPRAVLCVSKDGAFVVVHRDVLEGLASELNHIARELRGTQDAASVEAAVDRIAQLLRGAVDTVEISSGPSYVIEGAPSFDNGERVHRSSDVDTHDLRERNPLDIGWTVEEWDQLIDGSLGPYAMIVEGGRAVSICHSARLTNETAEAGVWTHPEFRGRGYASAVTAAWAGIIAPTGRHLFYSTSADNRSSQAVASRLGLRPIGAMWQFRGV